MRFLEGVTLRSIGIVRGLEKQGVELELLWLSRRSLGRVLRI